MKPTTEGQRLKALRESLGATQDLIAELAGIQRVTVNRAENDRVKWRSSGLLEGLMRAYSMSYEQLQKYLSGEMTLREAMRLSSAKIETALRRGSDEKKRSQVLDDVIRRASMHEEILQATRDAAAVAFAQVNYDVPVAHMVKQVLALNRAFRDHIENTVRALKSDVRAPR